MKKAKREHRKYYLGLDIGTDSVGYAAAETEENGYKLLKYAGEPIWGAHLFEAAGQSSVRRGFRTARRRLDRRQQRVYLTQEIFAREVSKVDPDFYKRIAESALYAEDRSYGDGSPFLFTDPNYTDKDYHKQYPTIHHLICELMQSSEAHDVRLVYLAIAYLMAHRGHFLKEIDKDNIDAVLDFSCIYDEFMQFFKDNDYPCPWNCDEVGFSEILKSPLGITAKDKKFKEFLFDGKVPKSEEDAFNCASLIKLLSGGTVKLKDLFNNDEMNELGSIALSTKEEDFEAKLAELGDDSKILILLKNLYDWSVLSDILSDCRDISEAKVQTYEQHKMDLKYLKAFIRKYYPNKYNEVFRYAKKDTANYVAYSYNVKSADPAAVKSGEAKKATKEDFCSYIKGIVKNCEVDPADENAYFDMVQRLDRSSFMPKQVNGDNRVIPYQLYWTELKKILDKAATYLPFLMEKDVDGLTPKEKLLSVFEFRIPYFVGPLRKDNSEFSWIERKAEGKIYPWNFEEMVDLDLSEKSFIKRMTRVCTYLPGEKVLPKCSLLYQEYMLLNELNNLCIDGVRIPVTLKQEIVDKLFKTQKRVTVKRIKDYILSSGLTGEISGVDTNIKSSLTSYHVFRRLLESGKLSVNQAEDIIEHFTYTESKSRAAKWLEREFAFLDSEDKKYLSSQKFKDFGRLSREFLTGIYDVCPETGEVISIIDALRNSQENLMQLLSDKHGYAAIIEARAKEYYSEHSQSLTERLEDMYISPAVKRPIMRTLDIVKDIRKACGDPEKIFVEMARGGEPDKKGKRTVSRRDKILEFYKAFPKEEVRLLSAQLEGKTDRELQSEALYLYFIQLGKCMYSGRALEINNLKTAVYNIDHIYPQSKVKDDSIDNKVLVLSEINDTKKAEFPIDHDIRANMRGFWRMLFDKNLISEEKWRRLTRSTPFTEDEKWGFINRQLTETRQSTKAIAKLLIEMFPNTEIVYVKAGLVSEFRQEFDLLKARSANDLHHAKDAYLNIVVGNVYNNCFSKRWFNIDGNYSIKTGTLFGKERKCGDKTVWQGSESIAAVKKLMNKNAAHLTRYAFCRHGGFFDQMPVRAQDNTALRRLKSNLPVEKYGGYNKPTASFFALVKYTSKKKTDIMVMPVELLFSDRFLNDPDFALWYAKETISQILNQEILEIDILRKKLKINTMFSFGGFRACLGGKSSGGKKIGLYPMESLAASSAICKFIKHLERFAEKKKNSSTLQVQPDKDKITIQENIDLYDYYTEKLRSSKYKIFWGSFYNTLSDAKNDFAEMAAEEQVETLLNIGQIFKSNRSGGCDLISVGASKSSCVCDISSNLSNWKKLGDVRIIDSSASGIFENVSENLLDLL